MTQEQRAIVDQIIRESTIRANNLTGLDVKFLISYRPSIPNDKRIHTLLLEVSKYYSIPLPLMTRKGRKREVVEARQVATYFMYKVFLLTPTLKSTGI